MITCFQEINLISKHFGADINEVVDILEDKRRVRLNKPVHFPEIIGGHCLIPDTELLLSVYDSEFLHSIEGSNEARKKEIKNPDVYEEAEKVRRRADALEKELLGKLGRKGENSSLPS